DVYQTMQQLIDISPRCTSGTRMSTQAAAVTVNSINHVDAITDLSSSSCKRKMKKKNLELELEADSEKLNDENDENLPKDADDDVMEEQAVQSSSGNLNLAGMQKRYKSYRIENIENVLKYA